MQWRNLMARRWTVFTLGLFGLVGAVAIAHAAREPLFVLANDEVEDDDDVTGWLGVYIQDIDQDLAESERLPSTDGVMVNGIVKGSPAADAGLKKGDVILSFNDKLVNSVRRLTLEIEETKPGSKVNVLVWRDGEQKYLTAEIAQDLDWGADSDWDWNWTFDPPDVPETPEPPHAPHAYSFSLGQLSSSYIGVSLYEMSEQLAAAMGATDGGALINEVEKDSPAEKAGLKAGDVIVEIDHRKVYDTDDVRKAIQKKKDGETVAVRVLRGKNEDRTVDVTVESNDTWSGVGAPRARFRMRPDHATLFELPDLPREKTRNAMRENMDEWRIELQDEMRELREQLQELREKLDDLR